MIFKNKKLIAVVFIISVFTGLLTSCSSQKLKDSSSIVVMKVNGTDIYAEELLSYYRPNKDYVDSLFKKDPSLYSDPSYLQMLENGAKSDAAEQIFISEAIRHKCDDYKIGFDQNDAKRLQDELQKNIKDMGGQAAYKKMLKENKMSEKFYLKKSENALLYAKLYVHLCGAKGELVPSEAEVKEYMDTASVQISHILLKTKDASGNPLSEDKKAELKKKAEGILKEAKSGADFTGLVKKYGEDTGLTDKNKWSYLIVQGQLENHQELATQSLQLKPGEISGVVETSEGYEIIKRIPLTADSYKEYYNQVSTTIAGTKFNNKTQEWAKQLKVEYTDEYQKISFSTLNQYS